MMHTNKGLFKNSDSLVVTMVYIQRMYIIGLYNSIWMLIIGLINCIPFPLLFSGTVSHKFYLKLAQLFIL